MASPYDDAPSATPQLETRQLPGFGSVTPAMLSQINVADKSAITPYVWGANLTGIVLITLVVSTRLAVRHFMVRKFFADDVLIVVAALCLLVLCSVSLAATRVGFGQHIWNLSEDTLLDSVKKCIQLMFVGNIAYACAITFTKFSIITSYLRIFPNPGLRQAMFVCGAIVGGLFIAAVPACIFQCNPVAAAWDFSIQGAACYDFVNFLYASTAISVATDLFLCLAPLPFFWKLQLPTKQKILVCFLFALGGFAAVACVIRLSVLHLLVNGIDVTYNLVASVLWTMAETAIGIICVSIPTLRPLFAKVAPRAFGTQPRRSGMGRSANGNKAYARGPWSSRSQSNTGDEMEAHQTELMDTAPRNHTDWKFSRLDSSKTDRVWDGSAACGPPTTLVASHDPRGHDSLRPM